MSKLSLTCGDSAEVLKQYPDNTFDLTVTSPPYNLLGLRKGHKLLPDIWQNANINYGKYDDNLIEEEYQQQQINVLNLIYDKTKETGSLFYNHKIRHWERKASHPMKWLLQTKWQLTTEIIWDRRSTMTMDKRMLFITTERIYWLSKGKAYINKDKAKHQKDIWIINPSKDKEHPAAFPLELAQNCIALGAPPNSNVLDPYNGIGTTGVAAVAAGHNYTGIDLDQHYIDISKARIDAWGEEVVKLDPTLWTEK